MDLPSHGAHVQVLALKVSDSSITATHVADPG